MRYIHSLGSVAESKMDTKLKSPLDYIYVVFSIAERLLAWEKPEDQKTVKMPYLVVNSTRHIKRAYIVKNNQIVSFSFPIDISELKKNATEEHKYKLQYRDIEINEEILSKARRIHNLLYKELPHKDKESKKTYGEITSDLDFKDNSTFKAIRLFEMLMLTEPAYFRYDYDPKSCKGNKHPLYHLDCNFTKDQHYKIGLHNAINLNQVEDLLDKETDCWFLAKYTKRGVKKHKKD